MAAAPSTGRRNETMSAAASTPHSEMTSGLTENIYGRSMRGYRMSKGDGDTAGEEERGKPATKWRLRQVADADMNPTLCGACGGGGGWLVGSMET